MMEPTNPWKRDHIAEARLDFAACRGVFVETEMSPVMMEVLDIRANNAKKLSLVDSDNVI